MLPRRANGLELPQGQNLKHIRVILRGGKGCFRNVNMHQPTADPNQSSSILLWRLCVCACVRVCVPRASVAWSLLKTFFLLLRLVALAISGAKIATLFPMGSRCTHTGTDDSSILPSNDLDTFRAGIFVTCLICIRSAQSTRSNGRPCFSGVGFVWHTRWLLSGGDLYCTALPQASHTGKDRIYCR